MRKTFLLFVCCLWLCSLMQAVGQQIAISGVVKDKGGEPLPGVNILVKGTTSGTITDFNGVFSLSVPDGKATLVFNFVGFQTQEVMVMDKRQFQITLLEELKEIDEVVVVGYGTQKKVNVSGSVSSVDFSAQAESRPMTNISSALGGLSSGVTVRQSVGKPGEDGASIRIRGIGTMNNSNPLVVIDGMEGILDAVNPNDIESISILKDAASCAIYGSRAANGVILVTTKRGSKDRTVVNYKGNFSFASPAKLLEFVSDYPTYMKLMNESSRNLGNKDHFSAETIQAWEKANADPNGLNANGVPNWLAFPNTNWSKEMYQSNLVQEHALSLNGGSEKSTYLLSLGYLDNPGLVENTGLKRYSFRVNLETKVNHWLTVGTRTYASQQDRELGNYKSMLGFMRQSTPGLIGKHNGQYGFPEAKEESATANNLYGFLNNQDGDDRVSRFNSTIYSKVELFRGLSWDFNFNYTRRIDEYNVHTNGNAAERIKFSDGTIMATKTAPSVMETYYKTFANQSYSLDNIIRYSRTFNNHDVSGLVGYNEQYYFEYDHDSRKKGLVDQSVTTPGSATTMVSIDGGATDWALRSYFGRVNYAFKSRYLFEANVRYDGSSRFASSRRWGLFPSFSGAWRISEEGFMKSLPFIQNLKLRASWGQLGNNVTAGNYDYMAVYGSVNYPFGGILGSGLRTGLIANPLLEWESTTMSNIGLDAGVLNNRLTAEVEVYQKNTTGILTTPDIYLTAGMVKAPTRNTADMSNKGFEMTIGWKDKVGDLHYNVSGNFSYNKNEVTKYKGTLKRGWITDANGNKIYDENIGQVSIGSSTRTLEGYKLDEHFLLNLYQGNGRYFNQDGSVNIQGGPRDGMIRTKEDLDWVNAMIAGGYKFMPNQTVAQNQLWYGDYIYADRNGDGIYGNNFDRDFTGSSTMPKYTFGMNMNFEWKGFDLSMVWAGMAGFDLYWCESGYNNPNTRIGFQIGEIVADDHYYFNSTDPSDPANNINGKYPRLKLNENDGQNVQSSRAWLYDGSFLKLRNLTVGYTLPEVWAKKILTQKVRLYFSGENLLTFTSFPGLDPEMEANTNYPLMRQISLGANITF